MIPQILAHRGASFDHPENTLDAFRGASTQLADGVELDVRATADGALVICHDPLLPDGRVIAESAAPDLPPGVPTLDQALDACGSMLVNVEIKHGEQEPGFDRDRRLADSVVALLGRRDAPPVLVSSFDVGIIDRVRRLRPEIPTGLLVVSPHEPSPSAGIEIALDGGHTALHPFDLFVDEALVARCAEVGLALNVWTVDRPDRIVELARWGVDAIITNRPALARRTLADAGLL